VNYLAHLFLSGENNDLAIGNFIADHIKGNGIDRFSDGIRLGIRMHRAIDKYTDTHPIVLESIARLRPAYHKYSGVIVDMYYDHFLANGWTDYSKTSLKSFTTSKYELLFRNYNILPRRTQQLLPHMARHNWLMSYSSFEGLQMALTGMSNRTTFISKMENAVEDLRNCYDCYLGEFKEYFPQLRNFVNTEYGIYLKNR
jgi:acyl carrier protein phosphodiesterase